MEINPLTCRANDNMNTANSQSSPSQNQSLNRAGNAAPLVDQIANQTRKKKRGQNLAFYH